MLFSFHEEKKALKVWHFIPLDNGLKHAKWSAIQMWFTSVAPNCFSDSLSAVQYEHVSKCFVVVRMVALVLSNNKPGRWIADGLALFFREGERDSEREKEREWQRDRDRERERQRERERESATDRWDWHRWQWIWKPLARGLACVWSIN